MAAKLWDLDPQRRDALLNAALKEFTAQGYDNASTNIIAQNSGISKALMFHYVGSKQQLFFFMYDYFSALLQTEYFQRLDLSQTDLLHRLHASYLLQLKLAIQYPWIWEFSKLSRMTACREVNDQLARRSQQAQKRCYPQLFDGINERLFRGDLGPDKCKRLIYWSTTGFANQMLARLQTEESSALEYETLVRELDEYFSDLRKVFYEPAQEE